MRNPKSLCQNESVPSDVKCTPVIFIIGKTKTGKSTLASAFQDKYGFKVINIQDILTDFVKEHEDSDIRAIINDTQSGKSLSDEALVTLIEKRTSLYDCSKGWVLDGLPLNKRQCELLNKKDIIPTLVISLKMSELEIKKRVLGKSLENKLYYDYYMEVIHERL